MALDSPKIHNFDIRTMITQAERESSHIYLRKVKIKHPLLLSELQRKVNYILPDKCRQKNSK